jgi:RNA polymerase sigma factor (TIGR02999 family)
MAPESHEVTILLERVRQGSAEATNDLIVRLYDQFRQRAHHRLHHEPPGQSLATGDLMHEALLRLARGEEFARAANGHQVFRAFARAMRQVLIDHARRRKSEKRGGDMRRQELDTLVEGVQAMGQARLLALDEALTALAVENPREAEVLEMRFFGGYEMAEIADAMDVLLTAEGK